MSLRRQNTQDSLFFFFIHLFSATFCFFFLLCYIQHPSFRGASFAVRVHDFRLYHEVCRDVILRWMYPLVPDNATTGGVQTQYTYSRGCNYKAPGVNLPRSVRCGVLTDSV